MPRLAALAASLGLLATAAAPSDPRFAATCSGSETVQVGDHAPATAPYSVAFSADLPRRAICYDKCKHDDVYEIADPFSDPIRFANLDIAGQLRRITYSRSQAKLTDDQETSVGPIRIVRHAVATCRPAPFREPPKN